MGGEHWKVLTQSEGSEQYPPTHSALAPREKAMRTNRCRPLVLAVAMTATAASAQQCYSLQGSACVPKHYGDLDSSCQFACAVGKTAKSVQLALKERGHDPGPIDGVAGAKTQRALRDFQTEQHLPATGRMDKQSVEKLGVDFK